MRLRRLTAMLMTAGGLAAATQAHAQSAATEGRRERPPIRASATVEVIDSARGIDDIISRVRDQRDRRGVVKERTKGSTDDRAKGGADNTGTRDDDDKRRAASNSSTASTGSSGNDRDQLRPDKNDRPNPRADRDRREPRRQDSDTRQTQPRDRARWNHR